MTKKFVSIMTAAALIAASTQITTLTAAADDNAPPAASDGQTPPDKPDGNAPGGMGGTPPDKPGGNGAPGGMGGGSAVTEWNAVTEYTSDTTSTGKTYTSTGTDENAIHISGGNAVITDADITRTSDSSTGGDNASFYGVGAAVLTTGGKAYINGGEIDTNSKGGAGAFAYGDGVIYIKDTEITTKQSTSGGIHAAGGGTLYAWDLEVETNGESSAAIRSDRGGGTMVVDGGTYTSNGTGSPAVYCTADIAVNDAELNATGSEGICIEGLNSLYIFDSDLSADMPETAQNENLTWTVIVYQSMSGDAQVGNSEFYYEGGSIGTTSDILIYTTNTESHITLNDVDISSDSNDLVILRATGNANGRGWGSTGKNGADCTFTAIDQELDGDIIYDSISNLDFYLTSGSVLTGAVKDDESDAGSGGTAKANIYIDKTSKWIVTADSTCTNLYNAGSITDKNGKSVTIKDASGNVLSAGDSSITITVSGKYSESADVSGATKDTSFSKFAVSMPSYFGGTSASDEDDAVIVNDDDIAISDDDDVVIDTTDDDEIVTTTANSDETNPRTGVTVGITAALASLSAALMLRRRRK